MKSTTKTTKTMKHQANFYAMALPILIFASFMLPPFGGIEGCLAQAPPFFNYQGIARDNVGNELMYQPIRLRISILKGSPTGTESYKETHQDTTNEFGLFNVIVGAGNFVTGNFDTISWGSNDYFLKVEMDPTGGTAYQFMGTTQLLSVPYALHAKSAESAKYADSAGAAPGSSAQILSISLNGDTLSISGGNSVVLPDSVNDADADPANELQTLTKTGNTITLSNGGGSVVDSVNDADADPANELQTLTKTGNIITLSNGGGSVVDSVNDADADPTNELQTLSISGNILYISNGDSVILPATVPSDTSLYSYDAGYADTAGYSYDAGYADTAGYSYDAGYADTAGYSYDAGYANTATYADTAWFSYATADADWTIDADTLYSAADSTVTIKGGKVGIGIASPSSQFHLKGNGLLGGVTALVEQPNSNSSANLFLQTSGGPTDRLKLVKNGSTIGGTMAGVNLNNLSEVITLGNGALIIGTTSPNHLHVITNNQERLRIDASGNVGIGTITPASKFEVEVSGATAVTIDKTGAGGTGLNINTGTSGIAINVDGGKFFVVGGTGKTGIGTASPQNMLDVEGGAVIGATYSGTNTAPADGLLVEGNVGIGTTSPLLKLDARGANAKATTAAFTNIFSVASNDAASPLSLQMGIKTDATATLRYGAIEIDDAGTKRHLILNPTPSSSGYVGIGTTSPNSTLHIKGGTGPGQQGYVRIEDIDPTGLSTLELKNNAGSSFSMYKLSSGYPTSGRFVPGIALLENNHAAGLALSEVTGDIHFYTAGNNERMTIKNAGNVGIGTTSPAGKFHVNNDVVGSDSSFVILQSGNVGIGTTGPSSKLHIKDSSFIVTLNIEQTAPTGFAELNLIGDLNWGALFFAGSGTANTHFDNVPNSTNLSALGGPLTFKTYSTYPIIFAVNGFNFSNEAMRIASSGNVGIGTTTPGYPLHVQKSAANIFAASIENQDVAGWGLEVRTADVSSTRNALQVRTGGITRFLVRNDGNVGIGTTSPERILDVSGNVFGAGGNLTLVALNNTGSTVAPNNTWGLAFNRFGTELSRISNVLQQTSDLASGLSFATYNGTSLAEHMRIDKDGNVGIGTAGPTANLHVFGSAGPTIRLTNSAVGGKEWSLSDGAWANGTISLTNTSDGILGWAVTSSGNVGIGTAGPTSKLQVVGLPVFADNAAAIAGGLTAGAFYRTAGGVLMVVF